MPARGAVFAIVCFYVDPGWKRRGVASSLLDSAVEWARLRGATAIEAYPNLNSDFMGRLEPFERRGFSWTRTAGKRVVVRLAL